MTVRDILVRVFVVLAALALAACCLNPVIEPGAHILKALSS